MVFGDRFKNHILPDKIHMLNVSFLVPQMRREFGGCAGNIAYNLKLLGDVGYPMATVGQDFGAVSPTGWTRPGFPPTTSSWSSRSTRPGFHHHRPGQQPDHGLPPGRDAAVAPEQVTDAAGIASAIVAPDGRDGMIQHADQFAEAGIPFIFDPGQGLPMYRRQGSEALRGAGHLGRRERLRVADHPAQDRLERERRDPTGRGTDHYARRDGSTSIPRAGPTRYPVRASQAVVDPTGCGDAYRAGLIHGLLHGLDWQATGRIASLMGAIKIESLGPQNHKFTSAEFQQRLAAAFPRG